MTTLGRNRRAVALFIFLSLSSVKVYVYLPNNLIVESDEIL
jgi:hypothetical protein